MIFPFTFYLSPFTLQSPCIWAFLTSLPPEASFSTGFSGVFSVDPAEKTNRAPPPLTPGSTGTTRSHSTALLLSAIVLRPRLRHARTLATRKIGPLARSSEGTHERVIDEANQTGTMRNDPLQLPGFSLHPDGRYPHPAPVFVLERALKQDPSRPHQLPCLPGGRRARHGSDSDFSRQPSRKTARCNRPASQRRTTRILWAWAIQPLYRRPSPVLRGRVHRYT